MYGFGWNSSAGGALVNVARSHNVLRAKAPRVLETPVLGEFGAESVVRGKTFRNPRLVTSSRVSRITPALVEMGTARIESGRIRNAVVISRRSIIEAILMTIVQTTAEKSELHIRFDVVSSISIYSV